MSQPTKNNNNSVIRIDSATPLQMDAIRDTIRSVSRAMNFNYRIRERRNKTGRYATLTINKQR